MVFNSGSQGVPGGGCSGKQMTSNASVCISSFPSSTSCPSQSKNLEGQNPAGCTRLAPDVMDSGFGHIAKGITMVSPSQEEHAVSGPGQTLAPGIREVQSTCLATRLESSRALGETVLTTLHAAKAPSTWQLYAVRWETFSLWCQSKEIDPVSSEVESVLSFFQFLLETGLTESTLRGYVAAISDCHMGYGGNTVGIHPLIKCFLKGACRLCPSRAQLIPSWDLGIVLKALTL